MGASSSVPDYASERRVFMTSEEDGWSLQEMTERAEVLGGRRTGANCGVGERGAGRTAVSSVQMRASTIPMAADSGRTWDRGLQTRRNANFRTRSGG